VLPATNFCGIQTNASTCLLPCTLENLLIENTNQDQSLFTFMIISSIFIAFILCVLVTKRAKIPETPTTPPRYETVAPEIKVQQFPVLTEDNLAVILHTPNEKNPSVATDPPLITVDVATDPLPIPEAITTKVKVAHNSDAESTDI